MPIEGNVRYRFKDIGKGRKQRLAFRDKDGKSEVVEAVTYSKAGHKTGAVHSPSDFMADKKMKRKPLRLRGDK